MSSNYDCSPPRLPKNQEKQSDKLTITIDKSDAIILLRQLEGLKRKIKEVIK